MAIVLPVRSTISSSDSLGPTLRKAHDEGFKDQGTPWSDPGPVAHARRLPIRQAGDRLKVVRAALGVASPLAGAAVPAARIAAEDDSSS
jgi:hypothetical protein